MLSEYEIFKAKLTFEDPTLKSMWDAGNGDYIAIKRLMFHWSVIRGAIGDEFQYDDRWCFGDNIDQVTEAVEEWKRRGFTGEPNGWVRHPSTSRRRPEGDATREFIRS